MVKTRTPPILSLSFRLISDRQRAWAQRNSVRVDRRCRVAELAENLFQDLRPETRKEYQDADGNELEDKFSALYSSAAIVCNVFDYWRARPERVGACFEMSAATGMGFERKHSLFDDLISGYSSDPLRRVPNIDVELNGQRGSDNLVIECKFTEPFVKYEETHRPFTSTYFRSEAEPIWAGLSSTRELATQINRGLGIFERLDATQLIKTGLACQRRFGPGCWRFVYLWYEVTHSGHMTEECGVLTAELTRFRELTHGELPVSGMTWQELFNRIEAGADPNDSRYTAYLRDRYFEHA